jgi:hypothetical protein
MGQIIHLFTARNWDAGERAALRQLKEQSKEKFNESSTKDFVIEEGQTDEGDPWVALQTEKLSTLWSITKATEPRRSYYIAYNNVTDELHTVSDLAELGALLLH